MTGAVGRRRARARARGERGVVMVELALICPVLLLLLYGMAEYGMAFRDKANLSAAVRAGARVGASDRNSRLADYDVLQTLAAATAKMTVDYVVIFKANSQPSGALPAACATFVDQAGLCNVYTGAEMKTLTAASFTHATCANEPDAPWCPTSRSIDLVAGRDYLGVYVQARREWITSGLPGSGVTFAEVAVMQLEPGS